MISRHNNLWVRQGVEKGTRLFELVRASALGQVTRNRDQVRLDFRNLIDESRDNECVNAAKVYV
jgi:hypothetical protein